MTSVAMLLMRFTSCDTSTTVVCCFCMVWIKPRSCMIPSISKWFVGSSSSNKSKSQKRLQANNTFFFCPPLSFPMGIFCISSVIPKYSMTFLALKRISPSTSPSPSPSPSALSSRLISSSSAEISPQMASMRTMLSCPVSGHSKSSDSITSSRISILAAAASDESTLFCWLYPIITSMGLSLSLSTDISNTSCGIYNIFR
mmetsp:Transcript_24223/g.35891  ORF Transcript_24223/g.35891 Transcript_24223/m.35891 type:complete len:200 (+) Transcript_24223:1305-1904(+)